MGLRPIPLIWLGLVPKQARQIDWRPSLLAHVLRARLILHLWAWHAGGRRAKGNSQSWGCAPYPLTWLGQWDNIAESRNLTEPPRFPAPGCRPEARRSPCSSLPQRKYAPALDFPAPIRRLPIQKGGKLPPSAYGRCSPAFARRSRPGAAFFGKTGFLPRFFSNFCLIQGFFLVYLSKVV